MANIAITNYCNLKCSYCFANDMINESHKTMSIENYIKILKYLTEQNKENNIGIIGGEPTLHPQFKNILIESNQCGIANNVNFTLFTNGIELEQYIPYIGNNINILINCNNLFTQEQAAKFYSTLTHCAELGWFDTRKVTCGCNLFPEETKYHWIWYLVDTFNLKFLRCSVVSPSGQYSHWRDKKDDYFKWMKPIFINFCKEAKKRNVKLGLDCGYIPSCYFTKEEFELIMQVINNPQYDIEIGCNPVMDITPDLNIIPCFGSYNYTIPLNFENNWIGLMRYINYNCNIPKTLNNIQGPCATCNKICNFQCQGGCLAFSSPE